MDRIQTVAQELRRRRGVVRSSLATDLRVAVAEATVLARYGLEPTEDDLQRLRSTLWLKPVDASGRVLRVTARDRPPFRVYARYLDVDVYVFVRLLGDITSTEPSVDVRGWLPRRRVEEAPLYWFIENGEKKDYAHEVDPEALSPMPDTFDFQESCAHCGVGGIPGQWGGIWDYTFGGWSCCGCEQIVYDSVSRKRIQHLSGDSTAPTKARS